MEGYALLPLPKGLQITEIHHEGTTMIVEVTSEQRKGQCPLCEEEEERSYPIPSVSGIEGKRMETNL